MKKILAKALKTATFAVLAASLAGCVSAELTYVEDSNWRLPVTDFHENVFQTTIEYDYSRIQDFDESKIHAVRLVSILPDLRTGEESYSMLPSSFVQIENEKANFHRTIRQLYADVEFYVEDPYAKREPGKLVVWSFDAIGTYHLEYWDGRQKSRLTGKFEK